LAAAALADQPERLAALDGERYAVDGVDPADPALQDDPSGDREPGLEVLDFEESFPLSLWERDGVRVARLRRALHVSSSPHPNPLPEGEGMEGAGSRTSTQQAARWPSATGA